jgi:hypothetical protein
MTAGRATKLSKDKDSIGPTVRCDVGFWQTEHPVRGHRSKFPGEIKRSTDRQDCALRPRLHSVTERASALKSGPDPRCLHRGHFRMYRTQAMTHESAVELLCGDFCVSGSVSTFLERERP